MLAIMGVGRDTVAGFFAEVGKLQDYSHPRQIIKLAGLSLKENTSLRLAEIACVTNSKYFYLDDNGGIIVMFEFVSSLHNIYYTQFFEERWKRSQ